MREHVVYLRDVVKAVTTHRLTRRPLRKHTIRNINPKRSRTEESPWQRLKSSNSNF
jgi:hypothetical protein